MAAWQHRGEVLDEMGGAVAAGDWPLMRRLIDRARRYSDHEMWRRRLDDLRRAVGDVQHHGAPVDKVQAALTGLRLHDH